MFQTRLERNQILDNVALNKKRVALVLGVVLLVLTSIAASLYLFLNNKPESPKDRLADLPLGPEVCYGIVVDSLDMIEGKIGKNEFLGDILDEHNVPYVQIDKLSRKAKKTFDVRNLRVGKKYFVLLNRDSIPTAEYFIYDPSPFFYVVYDLRDTTNVIKEEREKEVKTRVASGVIETSLWNTMMDNDLSMELAANMEDVFGWVIDFHHVQKGDRFKVFFDEQYIEGEKVGVGRIHGGEFRHYNDVTQAFYYEPNEEKFVGYYDGDAESMKRAFLRAPVKYSRISSGYGMRWHPIKKRRKAHLGTDYAAPRGTPIIAVGDGTVSKASYTRGNGKYVKIRHNNRYSTQYLHMNGFAKGIRVGKKVKQGQTIGYVGSTGMATGPHVCFRFWKDGRQVNHRRLKFPPPEPMPERFKPDFGHLKDSISQILDGIAYPKTAADSTAADVSDATTSSAGSVLE